MPIGKTLDEFSITAEIGRGGMGVVYKAEDSKLSRTVAIKMLPEHLANDAGYAQRFLREAQACAKLSHTNIVKIHAVRKHADQHYIAMEFIEGQTLAAYLANKSRLEQHEAIYIVREVARALEHAHAQGIVHRDIKTENIMLSQGKRVRVMDFGLARFLEGGTQLTVDGARMGTPKYMSPEQCKGEEAGPSTDIYSLGIVLFELLTGRSPYDGGNPLQFMYRITSEPMPSISELRPDLSPQVQALITSMTDKNPEGHRPNATTAINLMTALIESDSDAFTQLSQETFSDLNQVSSPILNVLDSAAPLLQTNTPEKKTEPTPQPRSLRIVASITVVIVGLLAFGGYRLAVARPWEMSVRMDAVKLTTGDILTFDTGPQLFAFFYPEETVVDGETYYKTVGRLANGTITLTTWRTYRADGLYGYTDPENGFLAEYLRVPVRLGDSYSFEIGGPTPRTNHVTVLRKETVTTPAGTFDTLLVHYDLGTEDVEDDLYLWFAPKVGLVKYTTLYQGARAELVLSDKQLTFD